MALMFFLLFFSFDASVQAKTYKKKNRASYSYIKKSKIKNKKKRAGKSPKRYKQKRSGSNVDLRALTTEKTENEYTETPDNGVNSVETKTEL